MGKLENSVRDRPCWGRVDFAGSNMSPTKKDSNDARSVRWKIAWCNFNRGYRLVPLIYVADMCCVFRNQAWFGRTQKGKCHLYSSQWLNVSLHWWTWNMSGAQESRLALMYLIFGVPDFPGFWKEWLKLPIRSWICPNQPQSIVFQTYFWGAHTHHRPHAKNIHIDSIHRLMFWWIIFV